MSEPQMQAAQAVTLQRRGDVGVIRIDNPPVNAISAQVVAGLEECISYFEGDVTLRALVVMCAGRTFVAGGDISSFDLPGFSAAPYNRVLARLESQQRPVVAAMHGTALGGGFELALACHWRIATTGTQFGFPEVKLGLLPGSLGTQRLPRLVGLEMAIDLIASGRAIPEQAALTAGIIDAVVTDPLEESAVSFARDLLSQKVPPRRLSGRSVDTTKLPAAFLSQAYATASERYGSSPAIKAIVTSVAASLRPLPEGEATEARLFEELCATRHSRALRHLFFAQREASKIPGVSKNLPLRAVASVGILGAGTMGRGIAMNFLNIGLPVTLVETSQPALDSALGAVRSLYEASAAKGKLTAVEVEKRMGLLSGTVDDEALSSCDLVIEAVYESMELKRQVCARLGQICKPGAIIATNTSTLDVDVLARATGRPADVVGTHFFSPANVMRLLEIVRGRETAPAVLATTVQLAKRIRKVPVVSGVCYGFIGNRMAEVYMREAEFLIMEGASPAQVDAAIESIGMAMGPCRMLDMAGIDVGAKTVIECAKTGGLPPDDSYRALVQRLYADGRHGQKTGAGYYRYEGRKALPDPRVNEIATELAAMHGIKRRASIDASEIVERLIYSMVNEAAKILEEGIAVRGSDVDVVWTTGYGFPDYQGGPLFMADEIGLKVIVDRLAHYASSRGNVFGYWTLSPLLNDLALSGRRISAWSQA